MVVICSREKIKNTLKEINESGFIFVNGNITAEEILQKMPRIKYFGFNCYYNYITKKNEVQWESLAWYKKHNLL